VAIGLPQASSRNLIVSILNRPLGNSPQFRFVTRQIKERKKVPADIGERWSSIEYLQNQVLQQDYAGEIQVYIRIVMIIVISNNTSINEKQVGSLLFSLQVPPLHLTGRNWNITTH
jgi:hypothetical protein